MSLTVGEEGQSMPPDNWDSTQHDPVTNATVAMLKRMLAEKTLPEQLSYRQSFPILWGDQ